MMKKSEVRSQKPEACPERSRRVRRQIFCSLFSVLCLLFSVLCLLIPDAFAIKKTREEIEASKRCVLCHNQISPGVVNDWEKSNHAKAQVTCIDCHQADSTDADAKKHEGEVISAIVSPRDCSRCHPKQVMEFNESLHSKAVSFVQNLEGDRAGDDALAYKVEGKAAAIMGVRNVMGQS